MKSKFVGLLVVAIMMAISLFAEAKIIRVPADYPTIQVGIDAASAGDTVLVADGTYTGDGNKNLDFKGKAITVQSENGPESTIIDCEGSGGGFAFDNGESISSVVAGFTINNSDSYGIFCSPSSPLIENNIIKTNGYGIWCSASSSPIIRYNIISENSPNPGIYCSSSSPTIQNNNITTNYGRGIDCWGSNPVITGNTIIANYDGGIYCHNNSSPTIKNNTISENSAASYSGGISCDNSSPTIQNNIISGNSSTFYGGGVYCSKSSPQIINNVITRNKGGFAGGGICVIDGSKPSIINNTIARNLAQYGGGIYCHNSASTVLNTILWADKSFVNGDEIYLDSGGSITITYSDIAGGWEGEGNIDKNPLFVGFNDYHLQAGSPCIDAGTPDGTPPDDIEGNPRDEKPDMGAYEFQGDTLGAINGTVTDKDTGQPIVKAIVVAINSETKEKFIAFTDDNGYYEIAYLQPGIYWVICIKKGYKPGIAKVTVEAGKTTTRDFKLEPQ